MDEKMKRHAILVFLTILSCNSNAVARTKVIDNKAFLLSPLCKKYKCNLIKKDPKLLFYEYNVIDLETKEVFNTYIASGSVNIISGEIQKNNIRIDLEAGTLKYGASLNDSIYLRDLVLWSMGVKLDLKNDFLGTTDLVPKNDVDVFPLAIGKIGGVPVTFYIKSVPGYFPNTTSIDPKRGHLAYGIVDSSLFPDGLRR